MQSMEENNLILVRIFAGEDLIEALTEVVEKHKIDSALIVSAIGGTDDFELGYFNNGVYEPRQFKGFYEVLKLDGNICKKDGKPFFHIHAIVANRDLKVFGGHVLKLRINPTCEIGLLKTGIKVKRKEEPDTKSAAAMYLE